MMAAMVMTVALGSALETPDGLADWMGDALVYVHNHLPQAVCGLAVVLAPLLQLAKRYVPALTGWKALAANFALAALGVWAVTPPAMFWSVDTWMRIIEASGLAAGIFHTAKALRGTGGDGSVTPPATGLQAGVGGAAVTGNPMNTTGKDPQLVQRSVTSPVQR